MDLARALFIGFDPDQLFHSLVSVDFAELFIVILTVLGSLAIMVVFGSWWSR